MLIIVVRGIFLLGIISWYSTNVWKMIDGYFKDRFDKYLQHEYKKNPKMREDIDAYGTSGENVKKKIDTGDSVKISETPENRESNVERKNCEKVSGVNEESCSINSASVGPEAEVSSSNVGKSTSSDRASENKIIEKHVFSKNAFSEESSKAEKNSQEILTKNDSSKSRSLEEKIDTDEVDKNIFPESTTKLDSEASTTYEIVRDSRSQKPDENAGKKLKMSKPARQKSSQDRQRKSEASRDKAKTKKKIKNKVKTIILTDEDFKQAKLRASSRDYDFSEFDDDDYDDENEASQEPPEGILVSELPFKPRADIGNLERVTAEEFCPLSVEDEANCGETKVWP